MQGEVRVVSTQVPVVDGDVAANKASVLSMARRIVSAEASVDLMLFHEACLESGSDLETIDEAVTADVFAFWQTVAAETGAVVLAGRLERDQDGALHNRATAFAPDGRILADYAKMHLYNQERDSIVPGDDLGAFELNGMRIGVMICADLGFPELARAYALAGCDVLAVPSSWAYPDDDLWEICCRARAAENGLWLVSCDRVGPTARGLVKVGRSMCCDPNGFVTANLAEKPDAYFLATLCKGEVDERRADMKWLEWVRPDVYARIWGEALDGLR